MNKIYRKTASQGLKKKNTNRFISFDFIPTYYYNSYVQIWKERRENSQKNSIVVIFNNSLYLLHLNFFTHVIFIAVNMCSICWIFIHQIYYKMRLAIFIMSILKTADEWLLVTILLKQNWLQNHFRFAFKFKQAYIVTIILIVYTSRINMSSYYNK